MSRPSVLPGAAPLPIDSHLEAIAAAVRGGGAAVVVAPPGAGKSTRVPPALAAAGPVILLQPRRVAARSLASRIAAEQGLALGEEVGWQVRGERRAGPRTRLLVATEGILTARLQRDPLLSDFGCVVIDEFHERSQHADVALALARQAARARGDLGLVVMSATLDAGPVAEFLGGCPVFRIEARRHPVEIRYEPGAEVAGAARDLASRGGHVLCFLPGAGEIRRAGEDLAAWASGAGVRVLPLHGRLDPDAQDAALAPSPRSKLILATNLAETSLTVEGVTAVVDSGRERVLRYDAAKGLDRLETERISADSAEQRAGRAGRLAPGVCVRLWSPAERLRPHREPELERVDLAGAVLDVIAWGGDPRRFEWFERPPEEALERAFDLLVRLEAWDGRRLTPLGERMRDLPLHPRLARVLIEAGGSRLAAAACAVLSEPQPPLSRAPAGDCDLLSRIDRLRPRDRISRLAEELSRAAGRALGSNAADDERALRRALHLGFPDRLARRREVSSPRFVLASGHGARLADESGVRDAELITALDLLAGRRGAGSEALIRLASAVERSWIEPDRVTIEHRLEPGASAVQALEARYYDALLLEERPVAADAERAAPLLVAELRRRGLQPRDEDFARRARFAGLELDLGALWESACAGRTELPDVELATLVRPELRRQVESRAPEHLALPSGRRVRLNYTEDGGVTAAVRLQELFGLGETPRLSGVPVLLSLLAPNGRPVQTTRDLRSFWNRTYPEVRKELRGRYPKHPWPEDPWTAPPTSRARPRSR